MKILTKRTVIILLLIGLITYGVIGVKAQNTLDLAGLTSSTPAYVAFSMRKLSSAYNGNAIQVRRSSDNATQNIGFVGSELDITSLNTFIGSSNGYVTIWYDQSGNGRNMSQPNAINQPRIVNAGVLDTENGKPFIRFFKSPSTYNSLELATEMNVVGMVSVVNKFAAGARGFLLGHSTQYNWHDQPPKLFATYASQSIINSTVYQNGVTTTGSQALWNSTLMVNTVIPLTPNSGTAWDNIGRDRTIYNHTQAGGGDTELIAFTTNPSSLNRSLLEKNQAAYYGISLNNNYLNRNGKLTSAISEQLNKFGKTGVSGMLPNGQTAPNALPATPIASNLALIGTTANLNVVMPFYDGANTTIGICWGTSPNPTIAGTRSSSQFSGSSVSANLTGLSSGTTYYARPYATNTLGTTYGTEISFSHLAIGMSFRGGKVAYIYQPSDPGYVEGEVHGIIAANGDLGLGNFGCSGTVLGATATALGTGATNTATIITACPTAAAASKANNYSVVDGGVTYSDWYLPSINELRKLWDSRAVVGGYATVRYWSSTESVVIPSGSAQVIIFNTGLITDAYSKNNSTPNVRAIRYF
ncbi:arabinofuranosidase catalytic domain-containing protein [Pedobacter cryotolerans]|uniref:Alpha-L-arabinofuranosidase B catalytic domain-containing protein n=1 Tax=Pedobacter cryotolerans TaxID=2571270 RepID=A0A4U1C7R7_9SPHI|nr:arabinofuranosidase catalytic domain-containing protein [Pedobacter cryotolerans]TKC02362.1 hypothetical protein FA045_03510 [Pedobacter cryotolerans]